MEHPIQPLKVYWSVFAALLFFTFLTVAVAYINFGPFSLLVALSIAITKAVLVIVFFMHVRYSSHLMKVFVAAGFLWLVLLIGITFSDYLTRGRPVIANERTWVPVLSQTAVTASSHHESAQEHL